MNKTNQNLNFNDQDDHRQAEENKSAGLSPWKVMIVDDQSEVHRITKMVFEDFKYEERRVEFINAYSQAEAKEIIETTDNLAVALIDVVMETEDAGLELIKYIRNKLDNNLIRIILRTGQPGQAPKKKIIKEYDINDYKQKAELTTKKLHTTMITALRSYKNLRTLKKTTAEKNRVENELKIATQIQENMLPSQFPPFPDRKNIDIFASMNPARKVGGDFYDFFFISENRLCFFIGDVSGKGIPAALFMAITKNLIKNEALKDIPLEEVFYHVNNTLHSENDELLFVTSFLGVLNLQTGRMEFVNAGHNSPVICREQEGELLEMESNFILGVEPDYKYQKQTLSCQPGDLLFLYTDGIIEARNEEHEFYSDQRLIKLLTEVDKSNPLQVEHRVKTDLDRFIGSNHQSDDMTVLILKYK